MRIVFGVVGCCCLLSLVLLFAGFTWAVDRPKGGSSAIQLAVIDIGGVGDTVIDARGGGTVAQVTSNASGAEKMPDKRTGAVSYEDVIVTVPLTAFSGVINDVLGGKPTRYDGSINFCSADGSGVLKRSFKNTIVSAIRFPPFDAGSKELARLQLTLTPESIQDEFGKGGMPPAKSGDKQRAPLVSNFTVTLDGERMNNVRSVSPIEFRQNVAAAAGGVQRGGARGPGGSEILNIKLVMPIGDVQSWQQWLNESAARGKNAEKTLRVELLDLSMKDVVFGIELSGVGIVAVRHQISLGSEGIDLAEVELYAEQLKVTGGGGKAPAQSQVGGAKPRAR